jgi:hypothetical protein
MQVWWGLMNKRHIQKIFFICACFFALEQHPAKAVAACHYSLYEENACKISKIQQSVVILQPYQLYYSGSILQAPQPSQTSAYLKTNSGETKKQVNVESSDLLAPQNGQLSSTTAIPEISQYELFKGKFQDLNNARRKKIQKCLKTEFDNVKVDGIWGDITFSALINWKNSLDEDSPTEPDSLLIKLKSILSNKNSCNQFITELFLH